MNNETTFLNKIKLFILNYTLDLSKNNYETYILELFLNGSVKCITINELRNLIDSNVQSLFYRKCYNEKSYKFFSNIKKKIILFDIEQIYDKKTIDEFSKYDIKPFSENKENCISKSSKYDYNLINFDSSNSNTTNYDSTQSNIVNLI